MKAWPNGTTCHTGLCLIGPCLAEAGAMPDRAGWLLNFMHNSSSDGIQMRRYYSTWDGSGPTYESSQSAIGGRLLAPPSLPVRLAPLDNWNFGRARRMWIAWLDWNWKEWIIHPVISPSAVDLTTASALPLC